MNFHTFKFVLLFLYPFHIKSFEFRRNVSGVLFSEPDRDLKGHYSLTDIKTMLKVTSTRFGNVSTFGIGHFNGETDYHVNSTYHRIGGQLYTAEAAALLNKKEHTPRMSILSGIWLRESTSENNLEIELLHESIHKAHDIFPATVWGVVISENAIATDRIQALTALKTLQRLRRETRDLQLGTRMFCSRIDFRMYFGNTVLEIIQLSDFIICMTESEKSDLTQGPRRVFQRVQNSLLTAKRELRNVNARIEVMGQTGYSTGNGLPSDLETLKEYWQLVNSWAVENNFKMWMFEAFDTRKETTRIGPRVLVDKFAPFYGWWRILSGGDFTDENSYIEKVTFEKDSDDETSLWVYIGVAIGILVAVGVVGQLILKVVKFRRAKGPRYEDLTTEELHEFLYGGNSQSVIHGDAKPVEVEALNKPYNVSFEIPKENLKIEWESPLGSGEFGCVVKAFLKGQTEKIPVAVKMGKSGCPKTVLKSLLTEIKILSYLGNHENIVSMKGAYTAEIHTGTIYIITEYCEIGSLKSYLGNIERKNSSGMNIYMHLEEEPTSLMPSSLCWDLIQWSFQIASGMEYLTSKNVVHADLATRNVLLSDNKRAKITDFGLSRRLYDYTNYVKRQQEPLPWRWMSVEALKKLEFSSQSDVWSFGVTVWEIFSLGDIPYPGLSWSCDFVQKLEGGLRMTRPQFASREIFMLMTACWKNEPQNRPTFNQLRNELKQILDGFKEVTTKL